MDVHVAAALAYVTLAAWEIHSLGSSTTLPKVKAKQQGWRHDYQRVPSISRTAFGSLASKVMVEDVSSMVIGVEIVV